MAKHIFAKFGDSINGEADDQDHVGWCEIYDFKWSLDGQATPTPDGEDTDEHARGKIDKISIKKKLDRSSTALANICFKGQHIAEVVVECYRSAGGEVGGIKYLELRRQNVVIGKYELALTESDEELPEEDLELAFSYIKITYYPMDKITALAGGQMAVEMDSVAE